MSTICYIDKRSLAKSFNSKYYFTSKACKHGHIAFRRTNSGSCLECEKDSNQRHKEYRKTYRQNRKDLKKDYDKQYRLQNKEKLAEYKKEYFNGLSRDKFLSALRAEGIPCSSGYGPQYNDGLIEAALNSKNFKRSFSKARLDQYRRELHYPDNDQLCKEAVWFGQNMLLGSRRDIDDIADAILKVYENRDKLAQLDKTSSKFKKDSVAL